MIEHDPNQVFVPMGFIMPKKENGKISKLYIGEIQRLQSKYPEIATVLEQSYILLL